MIFLQSVIICFSIFIGTGIIQSELFHSGILIGIFVVLYLIMTFHGLYELGIMLSKEDDIKQPKNISILCGWIWIIWISYGFIFKDVPLFTTIAYIHGIILIILIIISYFEVVSFSIAHLIFFFLIIAIIIPNEDGIYGLLSWPLLYSKVSLFFLLYVLSDINDILSYEPDQVLPLHNSEIISCGVYPVIISNPKQLYRIELKLVRSVWVLFIPKYILVVSVIQIVYSFLSAFKIFSKRVYIPPEQNQNNKTKTTPVTQRKKQPPIELKKTKSSKSLKIDNIRLKDIEDAFQ
jgi:hypothetical protein